MRKIKFLYIFIIILIGSFFINKFFINTSYPNYPSIYYSLDKKQNDKVIIDLISNSKKYIYFAIYTFTKENIANALIAAKDRGVSIYGIADAKQTETFFQKPIIEKLKNAGIPVETQKSAGLMHIKAIVSDSGYAIGSYNWTESATVSNDEILEVGTDKKIADEYLEIIKKVLLKNKDNNLENEISNNLSDKSLIINKGLKYSYNDAKDHIGESAIVEGVVLDIYKTSSGMEFIDFCKNYKTCLFTAVIFADDAKKFKDINGFKNAKIDIFGDIKDYNGKAEIIISDPSQIVKANS
jgi:hypothetical protein